MLPIDAKGHVTEWYEGWPTEVRKNGARDVTERQLGRRCFQYREQRSIMPATRRGANAMSVTRALAPPTASIRSTRKILRLLTSIDATRLCPFAWHQTVG
jgi:hypothetical protein